MNIIAEKMSYLNETKQKFKNRINSLGGDITDSTSFRDYLVWTKDFYNSVSSKTNISQNGVIGRTNQNTVILPSEYTQVDYIESSGTQYIDTGIKGNQDTKINLDFEATNFSYSGNKTIIGSRIDATEKHYGITISAGANPYLYSGYNNVSQRGVQISLNTKYNVFKDKNVMYLDNTQITNTTYTTFETPTNMYIFAMNEGSAKFYSSIKLLTLKIYNNNELIRDFIPCYRNSDNEIGLYDLVNDTFYTNQGTGIFTYGSIINIPNPDYPQPINNLTGNISYKITTQNGEQTFTIPLGDIELCKIDTYEDKIYSNDGRFYLYKETEKSILNGSEDWVFNSSQSTPTPRSIAYIYNSLSDYQQSYYSSHFIYGHTETSNRLVLGTSSNNHRWNMSLDNNITRIISTDTSEEKINKIKNWLSNDNVSVYYVLLEATTTEITSSNYPELYAALKEIQDYLTSYKINKEFILGYSSPEIEY